MTGSIADVGQRVARERLVIALGGSSAQLDDEELFNRAAKYVERRTTPPEPEIPRDLQRSLAWLARAVGGYPGDYVAVVDAAAQKLEEPGDEPPTAQRLVDVSAIVAGPRVAVLMVEADADGDLTDRVSWSLMDSEHLPLRERSEDEADAGWFLVGVMQVPAGESTLLGDALDVVTKARTLSAARSSLRVVLREYGTEGRA